MVTAPVAAVPSPSLPNGPRPAASRRDKPRLHRGAAEAIREAMGRAPPCADRPGGRAMVTARDQVAVARHHPGGMGAGAPHGDLG